MLFTRSSLFQSNIAELPMKAEPMASGCTDLAQVRRPSGGPQGDGVMTGFQGCARDSLEDTS